MIHWQGRHTVLSALGGTRFFVLLHAVFLRRIALFDLLYIVLSFFYLYLPRAPLSVSLNNLVFLVLGCIAAGLFHIHAMRSLCGHPLFYLTLPIPRSRLLWAAFIVVLAPTVVVIGAAVAGVESFRLFIHGLEPSAVWVTIQRYCHIVIVFILLRTIPLPLFILFRKHPVLVPAFLVVLTIIYLVLTMVEEFFLFWLPHPEPVIAVAFVACVVALCAKIITTAQIS